MAKMADRILHLSDGKIVNEHRNDMHLAVEVARPVLRTKVFHLGEPAWLL